jgi:glycosyltransferase involved in cell wall biosynthesis
MNQARVMIGLPVYNGARYLEAAIDSLLGQTYSDFEIIISDNASTDSTEQICLKYASREPRIKYHRNEVNRGGVWNFNQVFRLSSAEFFMWFSDDDILAPTYLERCVEVLDHSPSVILCFSSYSDIDSDGKLVGTRKSRLVMDSPNPVVRFRQAIRLDHLCEPWCGVVRSEVLRRTPLYGMFPDYDRVLLAELGLYGPFYEVRDFLFLHREHAKRSIRVYPTRQTRMAWIDPARAGKIVFPHFRQFREFFAAIHRPPVTRQVKMRCNLAMFAWGAANWKRMVQDLDVAARESWRLLRNWVLNQGDRWKAGSS